MRCMLVIGMCIAMALDTSVEAKRGQGVSSIVQVEAENRGSGVIVRRTAKGNAYVYDVITARHVLGAETNTVTMRAHVN